MPANWTAFWKNQKQAFNNVMEVSTAYFATQFDQRFAPTPGQRVLDYGCGPGYLVDYLVTKKLEITGADINPDYLAEVRTRHHTVKLVTLDGTAETSARVLPPVASSGFDYIVILSIVQYFNAVGDISSLVAILRPMLKPGGRLVIADVLDANTSGLRDAWAAFAACIARGRALSFVRFISYLLWSDYRAVSKAQKLLLVSTDDMQQIATSNNMTCEAVPGMTVHPTRANYIFTLK